MSEDGFDTIRQLVGKSADGKIADLLDEYPSAKIDRSTIEYITDPIFISGISLGRYSIRMSAGSGSLSITALDTKRGKPTHPHVNEREACLGKAEYPYYRAMDEDRWGDAISIIVAFLKTYNACDAWYPIRAFSEKASRCVQCGWWDEHATPGLCHRCSDG